MEAPTDTIRLADLTTLRLGGPARRFVEAASADDVTAAVRAADAAGERLLVLGGGSNLVVADAGFDGTVVHVAGRGIERTDLDASRARVVIQAGEPWDEVVAWAVDESLGGIECLSGIPGSAGATPIQNVGAYGASVADVVSRVRALDRDSGAVVDLAPAECEFAYRSSRFKRTGRFVVLEVELLLDRGGRSAPIRYAELARRLGVAVGDRAPLAQVREAVLELRRGKGMVLDPADPDSVSAGSFFTNPILDPRAFERFEALVHERLGSDVQPPSWPEADGRTKTSAAWLIERAGFHKGHGAGRVGISSKHTLALVNRGGATTAELLTLADEIRGGVLDSFGIELHREPVLAG
jgi:UDP-N-acetylmuramate dehydrogenase